MSNYSILYPALAHIFLVFIMLFLLNARKKTARKENIIDHDLTPYDNRAWPKEVVQVSNNIANQFETPILFHILCLMTVVTYTNSTITVILASAYTALRYAHAYIHVTSNKLERRRPVFAASVVILLIMFVHLLFKLLTAGS